jgi:molybdenum cofactor biosynthesis enzyme MoaA
VKLARDVMSQELLERILRKAKAEACVFGVGLFNWTEPFLHPDLPAMVRTVNDLGLLCHLSTNLNSDRNLREVLDAVPHEIRISCSGFTQEVYARTHTGGDIERVKWNMSQVAMWRNPATKVHLLWHQYKHNAREEAAMRHFCNALEIEFRTVEAYLMPLEKVLARWGEKSEGLPLSGTKSEVEELLLTSVQEHKGLCAGRKMPCRNQTQEITIDARGMVQLCCGVYDPEKFTVCEYLSTPIERIQAARVTHDFCSGCLRSGGHVYVAGYSHSDPSVVRNAAKAVYRQIAPWVPRALLRRVV